MGNQERAAKAVFAALKVAAAAGKPPYEMPWLDGGNSHMQDLARDTVQKVLERVDNAGLSWSGFQIYGDSKSIDEIKRMQDSEIYHRAVANVLRGMGTFKLGDRVRKIKGSAWHGVVVGTYSTTLTPEGYAVESEREPGSVQIYPVQALERVIG